MDKETVLIYQMGKVGSSSIYQSLGKSKRFKPYHIHTLNLESINKIKKRSKHKGLKIEKHITDSEFILNKYFTNETLQKKLKIITLVREPISRNIAAYFQNLDVYHSDNELFQQSYLINEDTLGFCQSLSVSPKIISALQSMKQTSFSTSQALLNQLEQNIDDNLIEKFKSRILKATSSHKTYVNELICDFQINYNHGVPLIWFQKEYFSILGIDIYNYDFPRLKGYQQITTDRFDCLIIKLETPDRKKERIIKEFLEFDRFSLKNTNFGNSKYYGEAYKAFKSGIQLPAAYINKMLSSEYTKHFYNKIERQDIRKKWKIAN